LAEVYVNQWYYQRMEPLGAVLVFMVALCIAIGHNHGATQASAALSLQVSLMLVGRMPWCIRMLSEITTTFNCVERVLDYTTNVPSEASAIVASQRPPLNWPNAGALELRQFYFRYRPGLPLVLKNLNLCLAPGERMGIVGRTGAGKTSLILGVFRIAEPESGSVMKLDGIDLLSMGLRDLRSRLAVIPQHPVMFRSTIRYNCDPFGNHSEEAVWAAVQKACLADWLHGQPRADGKGPLDFEVQESGKNLSAGQRQLVAIARAVLRNSKFVVLDEATAALDAATDQKIQEVIRGSFQGATMMTIAHRLPTILDSDRVMVLVEGEIVQCGSPEELRHQDGVFRDMVLTWEAQS